MKEKVEPELRKICVVVTARPSYARIKSVLHSINMRSDLELQLILAGSALLDKYGSVVDVIKADGFKIAASIHMLIAGDSLIASAKSTGLAVIEISNILNILQPDAVITIADRYETLATAIAGSYQNIPVVHIQGGEVTGSIDEKVRHAATKLADLHFVANKAAAERVIKMGENHDRVYITGCPSIDLAARVKSEQIHSSRNQQVKGVGASISVLEPYIVVLLHPVTYEWQQAREQMSVTLEAISRLNTPCFWFWPNVDAGSDDASRAIRLFREKNLNHKIRFIKNLAPSEFLELLTGASCLVGNSSVGIRECAYLGTPVVNLGERQRGRERASNVIDASFELEEILSSVKFQMQHGQYPTSVIYGDGSAGEAIAELLATVSLSSQKRITY